MWITQNNKIWYSESEYKELEQENKELKEQINHKFQNYWHKIEMKNFEVNKINLEYKQALEEIKELLINVIKQDILSFPDFSLKENVQMVMNQYTKDLEEIIPRINEVLNNGIK